MLQTNGIHDVPTTVKNPQANAICERMHQTMTNSLRSLFITHQPQLPQQVNHLIDTALATTMYGINASMHSSLKTTPGALVF